MHVARDAPRARRGGCGARGTGTARRGRRGARRRRSRACPLRPAARGHAARARAPRRHRARRRCARETRTSRAPCSSGAPTPCRTRASRSAGSTGSADLERAARRRPARPLPTAWKRPARSPRSRRRRGGAELLPHGRARSRPRTASSRPTSSRSANGRELWRSCRASTSRWPTQQRPTTERDGASAAHGARARRPAGRPSAPRCSGRPPPSIWPRRASTR